MFVLLLSGAHAASDEFIKLHKSMAEASSSIKDALSRALENASARISQQEEFVVKVKAVQRRVLQDLDSSTLQTQSYFAKLMEGMDTATQLMLGKWTTGAKDASLELNKLRSVRF